MNSVGRILRSARERQGRAVAEIADELCLTQQYLRDIEDDNVKALPGTFFYKNFVKQYAAIVGVKDAEIRAGVDSLCAAAEEPTLPGNMTQTPVRAMDPIVADSNRHYFASARLGLSVAGLAVVLLACSGFYAWWSRPAGVAAANPQPLPPAIQPISQAVPPQVPQNSPPVEAATVQAASVEVTAQPQPQVAISGIDQTVDGINHVVLNVAATEKTWISITSEGKRLFSGFLEPSQSKTLTGLDVARMTVGNAGGIEVRLNGKPIGPIGKSGQVRVVVFTPDNFEVLPLALPAPTSETL